VKATSAAIWQLPATLIGVGERETFAARLRMQTESNWRQTHFARPWKQIKRTARRQAGAAGADGEGATPPLPPISSSSSQRALGQKSKTKWAVQLLMAHGRLVGRARCLENFSSRSRDGI